MQQRILREGARHCKPVIVATQIVGSMIENHRPTRAEVSDVVNAVMDCADAIMLSGETAVGKHAVAAVGVMVETALKSEAYLAETRSIDSWSRFFKGEPTINAGITYSANRMVELLNAKARWWCLRSVLALLKWLPVRSRWCRCLSLYPACIGRDY